MKEWTRRAVAYVAGRIITGRDAGSIYDFQAGRHFLFSGRVSGKACEVYDFDSGCHISGTPPSLYHHGNSKHMTLDVKGSDFSGYDFDTGRHFSGRVSGQSISLFDHEDGQHHNYAL